MTGKRKKTKRRKTRPRARPKTATIPWLHAAVEDDLLSLAEDDPATESRWSRPRKRRISLRVDVEVVDWLKSSGPGYQTRINRILRRVMEEGKNRAREK